MDVVACGVLLVGSWHSVVGTSSSLLLFETNDENEESSPATSQHRRSPQGFRLPLGDIVVEEKEFYFKATY
jgi:hypothetical protein